MNKAAKMTNIKDKTRTTESDFPSFPHFTWEQPGLLVGIRGVYVFGFGDYVKIGWSTNIARRWAEIEDGAPEDLLVYLVLPGAHRHHEIAMHRRFAADRLRGEWFRLSDDIRGFLQGYGACPAPEAVIPYVAPSSISPRGAVAYAAAAFMGLTSRRFLTLVAVGVLPAPIIEGVWDLVALEAARGVRRRRQDSSYTAQRFAQGSV